MSEATDSLLTEFARVSKRHPCPVCGKPDWCLAGHDGNRVLCTRVFAGAQAVWGRDRELNLHSRDGKAIKREALIEPRPIVRAAPIDFAPTSEHCQNMVDPSLVQGLAESLGLSAASLECLGIGWEDERGAWTFPMRNEIGGIIGIRLRKPDGFKYAISGSQNGLFMSPADIDEPQGPILLPEGPTDTAACIDLGFTAVGRPSCSAGGSFLSKYVRRVRADVVVVSDNDTAGIAGAEKLANELMPHARSVRLIRPLRAKDIRAWKQKGAIHESLKALIAATPLWRRK